MSKTTFTAANPSAKDIHATVTNSLIAAIEANPGDWTMPWRRSGQSLRLPLNAASKRAYRGINTVVLWVTAQESSYASRHWATYKQWSELGAQVKKGEKGTPVVFYKTFHANPDPDDPEDDGTRRTARSFTVFNASQVDGFDDPDAAGEEALPADAPQRIETAERFIAATRADIRYGGDRAFYRPSTDHIQMPLLSSFTGTDTMPADEAFAATKLHEILHWSGAPHRLNREFGKRFGDEAYAFEELDCRNRRLHAHGRAFDRAEYQARPRAISRPLARHPQTGQTRHFHRRRPGAGSRRILKNPANGTRADRRRASCRGRLIAAAYPFHSLFERLPHDPSCPAGGYARAPACSSKHESGQALSRRFSPSCFT